MLCLGSFACGREMQAFGIYGNLRMVLAWTIFVWLGRIATIDGAVPLRVLKKTASSLNMNLSLAAVVLLICLVLESRKQSIL